MKYLILSDIHANWDALQAVLAVTEGTYDHILCCGDLVGYGPEPNRVVSWARKNVHAVVRGNHDRVCSGLDDAWAFNSTARESARWTKRRLTTPNKNWLKELKEGPVDLEACTLVHGSPLDEDEYVKSADDASYCRANLTKTVTFFGHTHHQCVFQWRDLETTPDLLRGFTPGAKIDIQSGLVYMINPGSVGDQRDGDPRAAWALYDTVSQSVAMNRTKL